MCIEPCRRFQGKKLEYLGPGREEFSEMGNCFGVDEGRLIPRDEPLDTTPLKNNRAIIIFVVGGPGVGRTSLCRKLAPKYGLFLISVSEILRREVDRGSEKARHYKRIMEKGKNIPADIAVHLVVKKMLTQPNAYGYLVIGFPRDKKQVIINGATARFYR